MIELHDLLIRSGLSIAVAESLSCGWLQTRLGSQSGSSAYFYGGMTVYNLEQKAERLQIDRSLLERDDCVSIAVAGELAKGVCRLFNSNLGIGTTGYAEPCPEKQVFIPIAYLAIAWHTQVVKTLKVSGEGLNRVAMQQKVADQAIQTLHQYLTESSL